MTYFDSNKRAKIMYQKVYRGTQIAKYRDQDIEKGDYGYQHRNELPERMSKICFKMQDVVSWSEYVDEVYTYENRDPKIIVELTNMTNVVLIENFNNFTFLMELFTESEQNPFITIGKQ